MIVTCPECAAKYDIPNSKLGTKGRKVKCVKCGHKWHQPGVQPEGGATPPIAPDNPHLGASVEKDIAQAHAADKKKIMLITAAGFMLVIVVMGILFAVPATRHSLLGGPEEKVVTNFVASKGEQEILEEEGLTILRVLGTVQNTSSSVRPLPEVEVRLLDKDGKVLDYWAAQTNDDDGRLGPNEEAAWVVRFFNPDLSRMAGREVVLKPSMYQ